MCALAATVDEALAELGGRVVEEGPLCYSTRVSVWFLVADGWKRNMTILMQKSEQ